MYRLIAVKVNKAQSLKVKTISQQELPSNSFTHDGPLSQPVQQNTFKHGK